MSMFNVPIYLIKFDETMRNCLNEDEYADDAKLRLLLKQISINTSFYDEMKETIVMSENVIMGWPSENLYISIII